LTPDSGAPPRGAPQTPAWLQPTIDYGPLGIFFVAYSLSDILRATAVMLAATVGALGLSWLVTRRIPATALITSGMMLIFGGLTLWLDDPGYLKLQSTLISSLFSVMLFAAFAFGWPLLRLMLGRAWPMTDAGWRALTFRFALLFAGLAVINEIVARTQSTGVWVHYNVFGQTLLSLGYLAAQWPLLNRYALEPPSEASADQASADD
jgi:intracellular septation protein